MDLWKYSKVVSKLGSTSHLLLGNGFSISLDSKFGYGSLFEYAKSAGLTGNVLKVFDRLGTNNFEGVMRLLEDGEWLAQEYGLLKPGTGSLMRSDLESVKKALIDAVAKTHPADTGKVEVAKKQCCVDFLKTYHNIFTTNYDLLLYWVEMHGHAVLEKYDCFGDGVGGKSDEYVVFSERLGRKPGIYCIHGALHLYVAGGEVRKHCWNRSGKTLIQSIQDGLDKGQYPLFVAEGLAEKKLEQIQRSGYLHYCLGKLERIQSGDLVVYGLSFGDSDQHICDVIAKNAYLKRLYVALHGGSSSSGSLATRANIDKLKERRKNFKLPPLEVVFYESESCPIWAPASKP